MPVDFELRDQILSNMKEYFYDSGTGNYVIDIPAPDPGADTNTNVQFPLDFLYTHQFNISTVFENNENIKPAVVLSYPVSDIKFTTAIGWVNKKSKVLTIDYTTADQTRDDPIFLKNEVGQTKSYSITVTKPIINEIHVSTSRETTCTSRVRLEIIQFGIVLGIATNRALEIERTEDSPNTFSIFRLSNDLYPHTSGVLVNINEPVTLRFTHIPWGQSGTDTGIVLWENSADEIILNTYYNNPSWREGTYRKAIFRIEVYSADKKEGAYPGQNYIIGAERITTKIANEILRRALLQWVTELDGIELIDWRSTTEEIVSLPNKSPVVRIVKTKIEFELVYEFGIDIVDSLASVTITINN